jgi:methionyl-tRNA formyltransferase
MKTIVGFLSREHGLDVLQTLVKNNHLKVITVFTHKLNPKSQDKTRGIRKDFQKFIDLCKQENIELISIDTKDSEIKCPNCDFIVEVSWRYLISPEIIKKANILAFGIHRGKLPEYAGAEPIKQALLKNEKEIIISAHHLDSKIDAGKVITTKSFKINLNSQISLEKNIQIILDDITPLFSKILLKVLEKFM